MNATKVAIQGYQGAFHELAARHFYTDRALEVVPADTFEQMIGLVETQQHAHVGMMAIENTLTGSLLNNYRLLDSSNLQVIGEVYLRIRQNLMVWPGQRIEDLKEVHSHPVAIDQCLQFFKAYPNVRLIKMEDTALAAKNIREKELKDIGAVGSSAAAQVYDLEIIAPSIETNKQNFTRFLALEHRDKIIDHEFNKVSISFTVKHEVGSLHIVLAALAINKANLSKIQSVPIVGRGWEYMIFIDFVLDDPSRFEFTIESLRHLTDDLKILGTYPEGKHYEG